jgi:hypothetical protein
MRTNRNRHSFKYALLLPLALGCTPPPQDGGVPKPPPGGWMLPDCTDGQVLVADSAGAFKCGAVSTSRINVDASCSDANPRQALTSDGAKLSCINLAAGGSGNNPLNQTITTQIERSKTLQILGGTVQAGLTARYVGLAKDNGGNVVKSNGDFVAKFGNKSGLTGASAACAVAYGTGAHMCTIHEIYLGVVGGGVSNTRQIAEGAWIYMATQKDPLQANNRRDGLGDNCATYSSSDGSNATGYSGVAVKTGTHNNDNGTVETGVWHLELLGGADAKCDVERPIACCL